MSGYFSKGNDLRDHWFKAGRTEVGTTLLVVGAVLISWIVDVLVTMSTGGTGLAELFMFTPHQVLNGEVWRVVSWPLANQISIWDVLNLFFFYIFGTELEVQIGKARMARLLVGIWAALTVAATIVGLGLNSWAALAGIGMVQFIVLLLWIAEYPRRPFFFGIPAWLIGAVLVGVQALQMLAGRNILGLLEMALAFVLVALIARRLGLLRDYDWIPRLASASRPAKPGRTTRAAKEQAKRQASRAKDDARLDELLDLISEKGMESLSAAQRRELMKLRNRR